MAARRALQLSTSGHEWAAFVPQEQEPRNARQRKRLELQQCMKVARALESRGLQNAAAAASVDIAASEQHLTQRAQPAPAGKRARTHSGTAASAGGLKLVSTDTAADIHPSYQALLDNGDACADSTADGPNHCSKAGFAFAGSTLPTSPRSAPLDTQPAQVPQDAQHSSSPEPVDGNCVQLPQASSRRAGRRWKAQPAIVKQLQHKAHRAQLGQPASSQPNLQRKKEEQARSRLQFASTTAPLALKPGWSAALPSDHQQQQQLPAPQEQWRHRRRRLVITDQPSREQLQQKFQPGPAHAAARQQVGLALQPTLYLTAQPASNPTKQQQQQHDSQQEQQQPNRQTNMAPPSLRHTPPCNPSVRALRHTTACSDKVSSPAPGSTPPLAANVSLQQPLQSSPPRQQQHQHQQSPPRQQQGQPAVAPLNSVLGWTPGPTPSCIREALELTLAPGSIAGGLGTAQLIIPDSQAEAEGELCQPAAKQQTAASELGRWATVEGQAQPTAAASQQQQRQQAGVATVGETPAAAIGPPCVDSPLLVPLSGAGGAIRQTPSSTFPGPLQLFVAETPADALPAPDLEQHARLLDSATCMAAQQQQQPDAVPPLQQPQCELRPLPQLPETQQHRQGLQRLPCAPANSPLGHSSPLPKPAADTAGLDITLYAPVLLAVAAADGRHLALLLSSHILPTEPHEVLVLRLEAKGPPEGSAAGVGVVHSVEVQRTRCCEDLPLGPNSLQLVVTARGELVLILSALLAPADHTPVPSPALHLLYCPASGRSGSSASSSASGSSCSGCGRHAHRPLAIEWREALTCLLLVPGTLDLLAAGDGGVVRRLRFDGLWRSFCWVEEGGLETPFFHGQELADINQLLLIPGSPEELQQQAAGEGQPVGAGASDAPRSKPALPSPAVAGAEFTPPPWLQRKQKWQARRQQQQLLPQATASGAQQRSPAPQRHLLAGLSSDGCVALWDLSSGRLLAVQVHFDYQLLSLTHLPDVARQSSGPSTAGTPANQRVAALTAAVTKQQALNGTSGPLTTPLLFLSAVRSRQPDQQQVAAVVLSSTELLVLPLALPPHSPPALSKLEQRQQHVMCTAIGGCGLVVGAGGLLSWQIATGAGLAALDDCCSASSSGGAITCLLPLPTAGPSSAPDAEASVDSSGSKSRVFVTSASGACMLLDAAPLMRQQVERL